MSLYGEYVKEYAGREILETENGFATYSFFDGGICYIVDIYVVPEKRNSKIASEMAHEIEGIAREKGCSVLLGSVDVNSKNPTQSMKVLLAYGFEFDSLSGSLIYFKKFIGGK